MHVIERFLNACGLDLDELNGIAETARYCEEHSVELEALLDKRHSCGGNENEAGVHLAAKIQH